MKELSEETLNSPFFQKLKIVGKLDAFIEYRKKKFEEMENRMADPVGFAELVVLLFSKLFAYNGYKEVHEDDPALLVAEKISSYPQNPIIIVGTGRVAKQCGCKIMAIKVTEPKSVRAFLLHINETF